MRQTTTLPAVPSTLTIGLDVGDKKTQVCVLDDQRQVLSELSIRTEAAALQQLSAAYPSARFVLEVGGHSRWMSALIQSCKHEVLVVDPRRIELISKSLVKTDRRDARMLATLAVAMPEQLSCVRHRSEQAQMDLAVLHTRDFLVASRTRTVLRIRGLLKSHGVKLPSMTTQGFHGKVAPLVPEAHRASIQPLLSVLQHLAIEIKRVDDELEQIAKRYPAVERLQQVHGVGPVTSLGFVLAIDDPQRFKKSREVGPYIGLVPRKRSSGESDPQLSITRAGNPFLRRLLVNAAQYILGPRGKPSDLRSYGERIHLKSGKHAKKRAVVAVARKLAVLLHALWVSGADYDSQRQAAKAAAIKT